MPFGMSRFGSTEFFGRERQLLDGEKQPHRKGERSENAVHSEWQERPVAVRQRHCGPVRAYTDIHGPLGEIELPGEERAEQKEDEDRDGDQCHDDGDLERQCDATHVEPDEDDVADDPPDRLKRVGRTDDRRHVGADEVDDHRRGQHIFDVFGNAGDEPAPRAEGRAREGIGAAGMRQCRAHLGDRIGEAEIHDGDDDGGDEHAAPAANGEAEVPAGKVAGNDRAHAECPQCKDAGVALELALFEIIFLGDVIRDPAFMSLLSHFPTPSVISPFLTARFTPWHD